MSRRRVFKPIDTVAFALLMLVNAAAVGWFVLYWVRHAGLGHESIAYWLISFVLLYAVSINAFRWCLLPLMIRPDPMEVETPVRVAVATSFVPGLESLEMLEKTVEALVHMRIAHTTWVLDEGDDGQVRALCERLGALHFSRRNKPQYQTADGTFEARTKHGNYNAWLDAHGYADYDVIVGFDPDHVPDRDFLAASLGYLEDPSVGYVQLPQAYYNQKASFIARGAAEETYAYYSTTQMSSYSFGFPIVTGCHNVHRTTALRGVGGFAPHDADDLLITLLYRAAGWQGVYVPEIHARGLTPTDWPNYLRQQLRWARSVLDVKLRAFPRLGGLMPVGTRLMSFLHGFYYVQEGVVGLFMLSVLLLILATGITPAFMEEFPRRFLGLVAVLSLTDFYRQRFFLEPRREWGLHLSAQFLRFVKWPYLLLGMVDAILGKKRPYSLTLKVESRGVESDRRRPFTTWPHLAVFGCLLAAWGFGRLSGVSAPLPVLIAAALTASLSLLAVWSECWTVAAPFDAALLKSEMVG